MDKRSKRKQTKQKSNICKGKRKLTAVKSVLNTYEQIKTGRLTSSLLGNIQLKSFLLYFDRERFKVVIQA